MLSVSGPEAAARHTGTQGPAGTWEHRHTGDVVQERGQGTQGCGHSKAGGSSSRKDAPRRTGWEKPGLCGFGPQPWAAAPRCCSGPSAGGTSGAGRTTAALPMQALWHSSGASLVLGALPASPGRKESPPGNHLTPGQWVMVGQ